MLIQFLISLNPLPKIRQHLAVPYTLDIVYYSILYKVTFFFLVLDKSNTYGSISDRRTLWRASRSEKAFNDIEKSSKNNAGVAPESPAAEQEGIHVNDDTKLAVPPTGEKNQEAETGEQTR